MFDSPQGKERDPISVRIPSPESVGRQPLLNEAGYANLSRDSLVALFGGNPEELQRMSPFFVPENVTQS